MHVSSSQTQTFIFFSVICGCVWCWMGSLCKNIKLMLQFLKVLFLVLHFSFYTSMAFLMMLSIILLSMLMILLSTLSVSRLGICGNKTCGFWTWIWPKGHCRLVQEVEKTQLVLFHWSNNFGVVDGKVDRFFLEGKSSFKMLGLLFPSKLVWGSYIVSAAKTASKKSGSLVHSPEVVLYHYKYVEQSFMEYCCDVWVCVPN